MRRPKNYGGFPRTVHPKTPEYVLWMNMNRRCHSGRGPAFQKYGAKGVYVCDEWRNDFLAFYAYVGARPTPQHSLDRINSKDGYRPGNVRWATPKEQSVNRPTWVHTLELDGIVKTMTDWAAHIGIGRKTLYDRLENGWTIREALTTPPLRGRRTKSIDPMD